MTPNQLFSMDKGVRKLYAAKKLGMSPVFYARTELYIEILVKLEILDEYDMLKWINYGMWR